ncbi:hypothetical protein MHC_01070 [Mycoplasma haemocanis str. Illinois]|uniref:Uncharacterized protein n=1 Tax=Mycoplasma haemocanis (strain Illinois) TaxID=1111676 RepID=H6N608_MYCHN|nr:hypothetical protein [Mycoplasma haemocanis]AEW45080.1 hypothetical protein MHC_01070 [Mycoplasma haemocanis str. Illinois]
MVKAVVVLLGAGTATVGGVLTYKSFIKPTTHSIRDLLAVKNPEKRLISKATNGSSTEWKAAWKLYLSNYKKNGKNPFSLNKNKPDTEPDGNENAPSEFMNKCEELSRDMVVDKEDNRYKNVLAYCTRVTLVSDLISENYPSKKVLSKDEAGSTDGWKKAWSNYKTFNTNKTKGKDAWNLSDWPTQNEDNAPNTFIDKCAEKVRMATFDLNNEDYLNAVKWCTR